MSENIGQLDLIASDGKVISQLSTICHQLKLEAPDGKMRNTDCANTETLFRIIQTIPSSKVEPLKLPVIPAKAGIQI